MNAVELVEYIFESKAPFFQPFLRALESSSRFKEFVEVYRNKIRKKIRETGYDSDDVKDVMAESTLALLLLQVDCFSRVEYERYSTEEQNPDLTVTDGQLGIDFNVEVKRIRSTDVEKRLELWKQQVVKQIIAVPSKSAFSMHMGGFDSHPDLVDRLEAKTEDVIHFIKETIIASDEETRQGSEKRVSVPGFEGEFELWLSKPLQKLTSEHTSYYGGAFPIFFTHKEYRKFGDEICDPKHLGQMRPDMVNILAIVTDSSTHEDSDLLRALASLEELAVQGNNEFFVEKGFKGSEDFARQLQRVSGIIFRSIWVPDGSARNVLWCNDKAEHPIPKDIGAALQAMDYPASNALSENILNSVE